MYLSVIIPVYNEEKRIGKTLDRVLQWLRMQSFEWEVVVVSDASKDATAEIVKQYVAREPRLRLVGEAINHGKGYSVRQGMREAKGDIRLFTDADNSTDISNFSKMQPLFEQGFDVVISSRDAKDAKGAAQTVKQPFLKIVLGNIGNIVIQILAVPGIWDTQNGFKAFSRKAAQAIFPMGKISRWSFDVEILALARRLGFKIGIIPIEWRNDPDSKVKLSAYFQFFLEVFKIRWWLWTNYK